MVVIVDVKKTDCDNDNDGQDEENNVVKGRVMIEKVVVMVLLNKEVIVLLNYQILVMNDFCFLHPAEEFIIDFGPFVDEFEFGLIAVDHFTVEFPLHQKGNYEPVNTNESVHMTFSEQQHNCHYYRKWSFNHHVHVFEHVKNKF